MGNPGVSSLTMAMLSGFSRRRGSCQRRGGCRSKRCSNYAMLEQSLKQKRGVGSCSLRNEIAPAACCWGLVFPPMLSIEVMTEGQVYPREIERSAHPGAPRKSCFLRLLITSDLGLEGRRTGVQGTTYIKSRTICGEHSTGRLWRSRRGQSRAGRLGIRRFEVATPAASSSGEP